MVEVVGLVDGGNDGAPQNEQNAVDAFLPKRPGHLSADDLIDGSYDEGSAQKYSYSVPHLFLLLLVGWKNGVIKYYNKYKIDCQYET